MLTRIYGQLPQALLEGIRQASPPGTPIQVAQTHDVGFTRTNAAR